MAAAFVWTEEGVVEQVAEDLRPFDLPYSEDTCVARGYGPARGGWGNSVAAARLPCYPSGGQSPAEASVTARKQVCFTAGPCHPRTSTPASRPHSNGARSVCHDPVDQRDASEASFDGLNLSPADQVPERLAHMVACDPEELRFFATETLLAGF